jgi:hypothetical protein
MNIVPGPSANVQWSLKKVVLVDDISRDLTLLTELAAI